MSYVKMFMYSFAKTFAKLFISFSNLFYNFLIHSFMLFKKYLFYVYLFNAKI